MKTARKIKLLSVLISVAFLVQNASATAPEYLPGSSHYQGRSYFYDGSLRARVDFAVYDTQAYPDQLVRSGGRNEDLPWWDDTDTEENNLDKYRYVYAYQIFVDDTSFNIIDYFAIFGMSNAVVKDPSTDKWPIGSMDDIVTLDAVAPDDDPYPTYMSTDDSYGVVWEFTNGFMTAGDHSWFLVLGSNYNYTFGSYTFDKTMADGAPVPSNPEPSSVVLFGIGGVLTFIRTRKKFRET